jgi:glutamate-5-semialdehyde dehydrogenase
MISQSLEAQIRAVKKQCRVLRHLSTEKKNAVLKRIASGLKLAEEKILEANQRDLQALPPGTLTSFRDRLTLTTARLEAMGQSLEQVAHLPDPVGEEVHHFEHASGLHMRQVRAPLGVLLFIFESRPNVITEAFSLAFKSGNAMILRGGSESRHTSHVLYAIIREALTDGLGENGNEAEHFFMGLEDYDRGIVTDLLQRPDLLDIVIPRGGEKLIAKVQREALMPIIKNDRGLCHVYVHEDADIHMALALVINAKTQRPGVCNSMETLLVHEKCAAQFLPLLYAQTESFKLQWRADPTTQKILAGRAHVSAAQPTDWGTEHLDLIMNCRVVPDLFAALEHIETYGSRHSEAIVCRNPKVAATFMAEVDAAAVYWNASTRFTDGFEMGLGGEIGISTQKLHVRGPVGLRELTTPRWIVIGQGQIRG